MSENHGVKGVGRGYTDSRMHPDGRSVVVGREWREEMVKAFGRDDPWVETYVLDHLDPAGWPTRDAAAPQEEC